MMILFKGSNIVRTLLALMAGLLTFTAYFLQIRSIAPICHVGSSTIAKKIHMR